MISPQCPSSQRLTISLDIADFVAEIVGSLTYFCRRSRGKPASPPRVPVTDRYGNVHKKMNYEEAFGFGGGRYETKYDAGDPESGMRLRGTYSEENIHLGPYSSSYGSGDKTATQASGRTQGRLDAYDSRASPSLSSASLDVPRVVHGKDRSSGDVGVAF